MPHAPLRLKSFPRLRTLASAVPCVAARFAAEPGVTESGSKSGSEMDAAAGLLREPCWAKDVGICGAWADNFPDMDDDEWSDLS